MEAHTKHLRHASDRKPSARHKRAVHEVVEHVRRLSIQVLPEVHTALFVPDEWSMLDERYPKRPKKVRVTLLLDEKVVKFFRDRGRGYQAYINEVLGLYVELGESLIMEGKHDRTAEGDPI